MTFFFFVCAGGGEEPRGGDNEMPSPRVRTLSLDVLSSFSDPWLEREATPEQRTSLLRFAASLPRRVADDGATTDVRSVVEEVVAQARSAELEASQQRARELQRELDAARATGAAATSDAALRAAADVAKLRAQYQSLSDQKMASDQALAKQAQDHLAAMMALRDANAALRAEVDELRTPAGRGKVGEWAVSDVLFDAGFEVEDTSMGARKDEGYMDLLVRAGGKEGGGGARIAVEVKNRASIDPNTDLRHFDEKARDGVAKGLFDSAVFVSLRAHTKRRAAQELDMLPDAEGDCVVPVSYVGPDRGRGAPPLSQEALQSHVCLHACVLAQCASIKAAHARQRSSADADAASEADARVRSLLDAVRAELQATLDDMNAQTRLIASLQATVRGIRLRAMRLFAAMCDAHRAAPSLGAPTEPAWMPDLRHAADKAAAGVTDALIWKNLSEPQKKRISDQLGGRETFLKAARATAREEEEAEGRRKKKRKAEEEDGEEGEEGEEEGV